MNTAEMRLLTVPQFARRGARTEDEVLALIQARDVKALRPDPEGGYRVLESEVDRLLQTRTTRIKPVRNRREGVVENTVALETHLSVVTALETERDRNGRLERLNSSLQKELFCYSRLLDEANRELVELRTRSRATHERLLEMEKDRIAKKHRPWWKKLFS
jgi:hypothetical protein